MRSGRIRSVGARAEDGRVLTAKTETNCGHLFDPEPSEERFMFSDLKSGAKCIPDSRGSDRREKRGRRVEGGIEFVSDGKFA